MTRSGTLVVLGSTDLGGSESLGLSLAAELDRATIVFLTRADGPARRRASALGFEVVDLDITSMGRARFISAFARLCRTRSAGSVLAFMFGVHLWVLMGARLGGAGIRLAFVGNPAPLESVRRRKTKAAALASLPFVSKIVACSEYVAESVTASYRVPRSRVVVIHNWCDVDDIRSRSRGTTEGVQADEVVGMVARFDPIKDHQQLLRAFALVARRRPRAVLRLIGDGPTRPAVEESAAALGMTDRVQFRGAVDDVVPELAGLDVFAFCTTQQEGFGVVLAEAMAAGVPIVATDVGPVSETLDAGRGGLLVKDGDVDAFADAVVALLTDGATRTELVRSATELVDNRYSVQGAAAKVKALLDG